MNLVLNSKNANEKQNENELLRIKNLLLILSILFNHMLV